MSETVHFEGLLQIKDRLLLDDKPHEAALTLGYLALLSESSTSKFKYLQQQSLLYLKLQDYKAAYESIGKAERTVDISDYYSLGRSRLITGALDYKTGNAGSADKALSSAEFNFKCFAEDRELGQLNISYTRYLKALNSLSWDMPELSRSEKLTQSYKYASYVDNFTDFNDDPALKRNNKVLLSVLAVILKKPGARASLTVADALIYETDPDNADFKILSEAVTFADSLKFRLLRPESWTPCSENDKYLMLENLARRFPLSLESQPDS